jgi:prepilin-type N-terminal cleavage/methylation domain-containing protein
MKKNNKGFTLAELLIVVAIIAVLVAIAIPIFTNQLEKSREATDLANLRSVYAELATGMLTNDMDQDGATMKVLNGLDATTARENNDGFSVTVESFPVAQNVDGWQTTDPNVASFTLPTDTCPNAANDTCDVTYTFVIEGDSTYLSEIAFA